MKTLNVRTQPKSSWWKFTGEHNGRVQVVIHNVPDIEQNTVEDLFKSWCYRWDLKLTTESFRDYAFKTSEQYTFLTEKMYNATCEIED